MHISRFTGIHIRKDDSPAVIDEKHDFGNTHVYVKSMGQENDGQNYRAIAIRKFHPTASNAIGLAHEERRKCESSIEHIANILSVSACSEHLIVSEMPIIAFRPDTVQEEQIIDPLLGELGYSGSSRLELGKLLLGTVRNSIDLVKDRTNGVAALAAALNCSTKLAQYRELVRFFEIAFRMPFVQIDKKLSQYLAPTKLEFERKEIQQWRTFRHPSIHGDGAISQEVTFELDVAPYLERMKIAALDVLFNKAQWSSKETARRVGYEVPGISKDGNKLIAASNYIQARFVMMDQFKVWGIKSSTVDVQKLEDDGWRFTPLEYFDQEAKLRGEPKP